MNAKTREMPLRRFQARKGDVFIWSADLAHGGSPIENPGLTRRSIVGHSAPSAVRNGWCPPATSWMLSRLAPSAIPEPT